MAPRPATAKQIGYIDNLAAQAPGPYADLLDQFGVATSTDLTCGQASQLLDHLIPAAREARRAEHAERRLMQETAAAVEGLSVGMYWRDGVPIKVTPSRTSGVLVAKRLNDDGSWDYLGAASRFVRAQHRMTMEQAADYGHTTGVCCCCGRDLTNPDSIAAGIGPVCASKF